MPQLTPGMPRWKQRIEERRQRLRDSPLATLPAEAAFKPPRRESVGIYVGLCILVQFPDVPGTIGRTQIEGFLNAEGYGEFGNNGSVRDYFQEVSSGRLDYTSIVTAYITTQRVQSYYTDASIPRPQRARELLIECLEALQAKGFDFTRLTVDGKQYIRAINVFYAGPCVNDFDQGLWPHSHFLEHSIEVSPGLRAYDYQITNIGDALSLGTFCHENGHMICDFPDLYDHEGIESAGTGDFCLMSAGGNLDPTNPPHVGAYLKYRAGWADTLTPLKPGMTGMLSLPGNHFCLYARNSAEYFILEYRQQSGRDSAIPGSGLAIWHVDEANGNNANEQGTPELHYECALMQADGLRQLEANDNRGDAEDLYPNGGKTEFSQHTHPASRWWDGTSSGLAIRDISITPNGVTFKT